MSDPEYKFPFRDIIGDNFTADNKKIINVGVPEANQDAEVKQHKHPLEDMDVVNDPDDGDFLTWQAGSGGGLVWRPGDVDVQQDDSLVVDRAKTLNFEGNVEITEESGGKATIYIPTPSTFNLTIQEEYLEVADNVNTINFEGQVSVIEESNGKVTIQIAPGEYFGQDYNYQYSEDISSTTSTDWQNKISYTTPNLGAGTYRVCWYAEMKISNANQKYYVRYVVDGTEYCISSGNNAGQQDYQCWTGFLNVNFATSGTHTIQIQWKSASHQMTSYIRRARIEFWRLT